MVTYPSVRARVKVSDPTEDPTEDLAEDLAEYPVRPDGKLTFPQSESRVLIPPPSTRASERQRPP